MQKTYQLDISIFFLPKHRSSVAGKAKPKQRSALVGPMPRGLPPAIIPDNYFLYYSHTAINQDSATITIGYKHILKLSYKEQYAMMVKEIKATYKFHSDTKYLFRFELQNNGSLHAHGIIQNGYANVFHTNFLKFGIHNAKKASYDQCRNTKGYLAYINKENVLPPIHNIRRRDYTSEMAASGNLQV